MAIKKQEALGFLDQEETLLKEAESEIDAFLQSSYTGNHITIDVDKFLPKGTPRWMHLVNELVNRYEAAGWDVEHIYETQRDETNCLSFH